MWPWLTSLTDLTVAGQYPPAMLLNTWVPPLLSTVVGVGLAALAGFGIGGLRPLGRWSELSAAARPWLFIHIGLMLAKEEAAAPLEGEPGIPAADPAAWLVVPALVLFTPLNGAFAKPSLRPPLTGRHTGR